MSSSDAPRRSARLNHRQTGICRSQGFVDAGAAEPAHRDLRRILQVLERRGVAARIVGDRVIAITLEERWVGEGLRHVTGRLRQLSSVEEAQLWSVGGDASRSAPGIATAA